MTLKLFEMQGEFGYVCERLEECLSEYELDAEDREWVIEASPDKPVHILFDMSEDPILPVDATLEPFANGLTRVTATAARWIEARGPGELWSGYND